MSWAERGYTYGDPFAQPLYEQWRLLRISELGLALGCLALIIYGGRRGWNAFIIIALGCLVIGLWVVWFYQPVWRSLG